MGEWVLILTVIIRDNRGGNAITSVPGFTSRETCLVAAKVWLDDVNRIDGTMWHARRAACVKR